VVMAGRPDEANDVAGPLAGWLAPAFPDDPVGEPDHEHQDENHHHEFARGQDDQFMLDHSACAPLAVGERQKCLLRC